LQVPKTIDTIWKSFYSIHFVDNLTGWLVGESGIIIKTIDGRENWIEQTSGTNKLLNSIFFRTKTNLVVFNEAY